MSTETTVEATEPTESEVVNLTELNPTDVTATEDKVDEKQVEPAKTFTQAEVDAMVQKIGRAHV